MKEQRHILIVKKKEAQVIVRNFQTSETPINPLTLSHYFTEWLPYAEGVWEVAPK